MRPLTGQLLISSPSLVDPNFRRTVVLMTHHTDEGAVGLVLSRPSELRIEEAVPDLAILPTDDEVVYVGGPVQPEAVVVLVEFSDPGDAVDPIIGSVCYMPPDVDRSELDVSRTRVFAGYSGWGPGQLERELEEPAWLVVPALPDDVFAPDPNVLWSTVIRRKGGRFTLLATMPFDPQLN